MKSFSLMRKIIPFFLLLFIVGNSLSGQVTFTAGNETAPCDVTSFCVEVEVSNFDSIVGMQFSYTWDTTIVDLNSYNNFLPTLFSPDEAAIGQGQLSFGWFEAGFQPYSLDDGDVIIELCFSPTGVGTSPIDFTDPLFVGAPTEVSGYQNGVLVQSLPTLFIPGSATVTGSNGAPVIVCPSDTIIDSNPSIINNIGLVSVSDCDLDQITYTLSGATTDSGNDDASGEFFNTGTTTVTYTATDLDNNTSTCAFDVTLNPTTTSNDSILQFIPQVTLDCDNNTVSVDVVVTNFDSLSGFQFGIFWDTTEIAFDNVANSLPPIPGYNTTFADDGYIFVTWFHPAPPAGPFSVSLPDGSTIFTLNFDLVGALTLPAITFDSVNQFTPVIITAESGNLSENEYEFQTGSIVNVTDTTPPDFGMTCLTDTTIYTPADDCEMRFNYIAPVATDACDSDLTYTNSHNSGDDFPLGNTTITYTATDDAGNISTCSFIVTVLDTVPPMLVCPNNPSFDCPDDVAGLAPTVSDACGLVDVIYSIGTTISGDDDASGEFFDYGVTTVLYIATDLNGNSTSCSFTVEVEDNDPPTIDCPGDINADAAGTSCSATVTVPAPTANDNCGIASITYESNGNLENLPSGATSFNADFPAGTTVVTYTVTDAQGLSSTCSLNVIVTDTTAPAIDCPSNINITLAGGQTDTVLSAIPASATDNCGTANITFTLSGGTATAGPFADDASGSTFGIGQTTVTYTATDASGLTSTCSFTVDINVPTALDITCPTTDLEDADAPFCADQSVNGLGLTINSNEADVSSITFTLTGATTLSDTLNASGNTFNVGVTTITYFATDIFGNTATCSVDQLVVDSIRPQVICPTVDAFPVDPGACVATVNVALILPVSATDNCQVDFVNYELSGALTGTGTVPGVPTVFPVGTTNIEYTVFDIYGNERDCDFDVVVNDTEGPEISCPTGITINVPAGTTDTILNNLGLQNATDVCGAVVDTSFATTGALTITNGGQDISGTAFPVGETVVTYTALDDAGNSSTCSFTITVNEDGAVDLIECPSDMDVCNNTVTALPIYIADQSSITTLSYGTTTVGGAPTEFINVTLPTGPTVVTYTAEDISGNTDVCSFVINVDDEAPTFNNCPAFPLEFSTTPGSCEAVVNWMTPTASDNCGIETMTASHTSPTSLPVGSTDIIYTATDTAGNVSQCIFVINVVDSEAPVFIDCPPTDIIVTPVGGANCESAVTWTAPTATDFCSSNITYTSNFNPGDIFPAGDTVVVYTATDESGNTAICTFTISVQGDSGSPIPSCPDDVVVDADPALCGAVATWDLPTATDDCSVVGISCTRMPGDTFDIGVTTVVCLALDAAGNDSTCTFTVTVMDNSPPVLTCPTQAILANVDNGMCGAIVSWPAVTATDDCDTNIDLDCSFQPGDFFPVGTTTVTCSATDDGGNVVTCSFDVTVEDNEDPKIVCPSNVEIFSDGTISVDPDNIVASAIGNATCDGVTVDFLEPVIMDNCPGVTSISTGLTPGDEFPVGVNTITYTATDVFGNTTVCSFDIQILPVGGAIEIVASPNDTLCVGNITLSVVGASPGATYDWSGPSGAFSSDEEWLIPPFNGNYSVTVSAAGSCTATDNIDITFGAQPEITASNNGPLCDINSSLELFVDGAPNGSTFLWTAPNGDTFTVEDPVIDNPLAGYTGTWSVTVVSGFCEATETTEVLLGGLPNVTVNSDCNGSICIGETCTIIGQEVAGQVVTYNWSSSPVDCIPSNITTSTFDFTPTEPGSCTIYYSVSAGNCSSAVDSIVITVSGEPEAINDEYIVEPSDSLVNISVVSNDTFNMDLGFEVSLLTPTANIPGTITLSESGLLNYNPQGYIGMASFIYELCVNCDAENCTTGIVNISVQDESCRVPNVITPNGDGSNDILIINCLDTQDFPESEMQIFNEWGDEVFYAKPYRNDWQGTLKGESGKDLPDGTYFYIFKLDSNAEVDKGHITIFR